MREEHQKLKRVESFMIYERLLFETLLLALHCYSGDEK